jgi:hypothetical protein
VEFEKAFASSSPNGSASLHDFGFRFVWSAGAMVNRSDNQALGLLASVGAADDPEGFSPVRIELRQRRWRGESGGVDLAIGLAQKRVRSNAGVDDLTAHGVTAAIGVEQGVLGADARVDWLRVNGQSRRGAFVGVRAGSYAAPITTVVLAVVFVVAAVVGMSQYGGQ